MLNEALLCASVAGVGLTDVGAHDVYDDDADDDLLLRSRSKQVDTFSDIPDTSRGEARNASTDY